MESSQITMTISLLMIVLFSIAIIGFSIGFANNNDAAVSILNDPELSAFNTNTKVNLSTFKGESEDTYKSIIDTTIEPGSDVAQSTGPFVITVTNLVGITKNIIMLPYKKIFGGSGRKSGSENVFGIFFTTFIAFLVFVMGLLIYKTLRGNP